MPIPHHEPQKPRMLLRDDVYGRLRDAIVDGTLAPGEQLRDLELTHWLGVSRTPIREALLRLADTGLVRTAPGRSTWVADIDFQAIRDAQSVVAAMHRLAVAEATAKLTRADLHAMREANRRFSTALRKKDTDAALKADDEFHAIPVRVCGNQVLATVLEQFTPVVRRLERLRFSSLDGRDSVALHARLVDLCESGDTDAAADVSHQTWQTLAPILNTLQETTSTEKEAHRETA